MKRVPLVDMNNFAHHLNCLNCELFLQMCSNRLKGSGDAVQLAINPNPAPVRRQVGGGPHRTLSTHLHQAVGPESCSIVPGSRAISIIIAVTRNPRS